MGWKEELKPGLSMTPRQKERMDLYAKAVALLSGAAGVPRPDSFSVGLVAGTFGVTCEDVCRDCSRYLQRVSS